MKVKHLMICFAGLAFAFSAQAKKLKPGTSTALFPKFELEYLQKAKAAGLKQLEFGINRKFMDMPEEECVAELTKSKAVIDASGITVWSCHLPFGRDIDISMLDGEKREKAVADMTKVIKACGVLKPHRLILHPSYEPIADQEREQRMQNSIASIDRLRKAAAEIGATLCIENLPRTCLGKNSAEAIRLVEQFPDVKICFDVNHLLSEDQITFAENVGSRIATLHISDYDKVNERHWVPGQGITPWGKLYAAILATGYNGPWMYETINDKNVEKGRATIEQVKDSYDMILREYKKAKN